MRKEDGGYIKQQMKQEDQEKKSENDLLKADK